MNLKKPMGRLGLDTLLFRRLESVTEVVVVKDLKLKRFDGNLN